MARAAFDADSGVKGKFCVWSEAEIDAMFDDASLLFKEAYGVTADGNWEDHNVLILSHNMALLSDARKASLKASIELN
jgi:uncharacterized protein YyaL (SSP411 family)